MRATGPIARVPLLLFLAISSICRAWSDLFLEMMRKGQAADAAIENIHCAQEQPIFTIDMLNGLTAIAGVDVQDLGYSPDRYEVQAIFDMDNSYGMTFDYQQGLVTWYFAYRAPPLPFASQILASLWAAQAKEIKYQGSTSDLKRVMQMKITNPKTKNVTDDVLEADNQSENTVYLEAWRGTDQYYALLGTPNGLMQAYSLAQHRIVFGWKRFTRIVLSASKQYPIMTFVLEPMYPTDSTD